MKLVFDVVSALALVGGSALFALALLTPSKYSLSGASAVQISQVYAESTYYAVLAVAAFALAGILLLGTKNSSE